MRWTVNIEDLSNQNKVSASFEKAEFSVGRSEVNDLVIPNLYISRRHLRFIWDGKQASLVDEGSINGTYICSNVSWTRCTGTNTVPMPLHLMIGPEVSCKIDLEAEERQAKSPEQIAL